MIESFWSTMQRELLDRQAWTTRAALGSAIFEWIEAFYNPRVLLVPGDRGCAPDQGRGVLASIGKRHPKQSLVHVLGRAVSGPMGAMDHAIRSNRHEGGTRAASHPDSVGTELGGATVVA
jgi:hypothetical protein